jgi:hypothetical protein
MDAKLVFLWQDGTAVRESTRGITEAGQREKRSMQDRVPGSTPEQLFMKEAAAAINEIQEQLEDEVRISPVAAEGQEPAAGRKIMARRKVARLATKRAQDYRW